MIPGGARGDMAPAWAPLPSTRAIRSGEMPTSPARSMAGGASRAEIVIWPGPMAERPKARKKRMIGSMATFPRTALMAYLVTFSSVPWIPTLNTSGTTISKIPVARTGTISSGLREKAMAAKVPEAET
jgi:hypothetical protein